MKSVTVVPLAPYKLSIGNIISFLVLWNNFFRSAECSWNFFILNIKLKKKCWYVLQWGIYILWQIVPQVCHWTCTFVYMCLYASMSCNFLTFWSSQSHKDISLRSKSKITFIVIFLNPWTLLSLIPVSCMYIIYAQVIYIWLKNERIHGRFTLLLHQSIWKLSQKRSLIFCGCHGYTSCSCFDDDGVVKRDILEIILWNHVGISLIS